MPLFGSIIQVAFVKCILFFSRFDLLLTAFIALIYTHGKRKTIYSTKEIKRRFLRIDIANKGANSGIKIRRDTYEEMMAAVKEYEKTKRIIILGESKNGKWVNKKK